METLFHSEGLAIAGHLARPRSATGGSPRAVLLCHGFPSVAGGGSLAASSLPELADRIAAELGWLTVAFAFRGCSGSEGDFALGGWLADLRAATEWLRTQQGVVDLWLIGFGTGGALAICAAADDPGIRGVAAMAAPADFDDWASHPRRLLQHARDVGIISTEHGFPPAPDQWARELREIRAIECAERVSPRPLLLVHGSEDELVPPFDARVLADAHGDGDLRIVEGAGHQLRHDPRAVAVLFGWLERQRSRSVQR